MPEYKDCACPYCEGCIKAPTPEEIDAAAQIAWCQPTVQLNRLSMVELMEDKITRLNTNMADQITAAFAGVSFERIHSRPNIMYYGMTPDMDGYWKAMLKWTTEDLPLFGGPMVPMVEPTWDSPEHQCYSSTIEIKR